MRDLLTIVPRIIWGIGVGTIISGGVVAFITIIGVIPLMAHRTQTGHYALWYENAIILGSLVGSIFSMWNIRVIVWPVVVVILLLAFGMFVGVLIIALAEVLDVFPIVNRRIKIKKGISLFVFSLALGKLVGSLYYWLYPAFLEIMQ